MSKSENFGFDGDITAVTVNTFGCDLEILGGSDRLTAEYDGNFSVENRKGHIIIKRRRTALSGLTRPSVRIRIPESSVPDIRIAAAKSSITVSDGIFRNLKIYAVNCSVALSEAAFASVAVAGNQSDGEYTAITVKNTFNCDMKCGNLIARNGFYSAMKINVRNGNIGLWEADFRALNAMCHRGGIQAMLIGESGDYNLSLSAKKGVCNRRDGGSGAKTVKCTAGYGNVIIDYEIPPAKEDDDDGDDGVAENTCGQSGT